MGPNTIVRLGVGVVIRDERGWVLLEQRSDCGWWGMPGGRLEVGESITQTAVREVKEETGLDVEIIRLIGIYSEPQERIVTYPDTIDGVQLIDAVVEGHILSGTLTCSHESFDVRFFSPHALPEELIPPSRIPLRDALLGDYAQVR
ncbi:MAG: DNA mismatch repair protein MutT [Nitrospirales bacterium]|nr:MAG: DNA mismatch repair protein MutT [Nitrospirales bacterium]